MAVSRRICPMLLLGLVVLTGSGCLRWHPSPALESRVSQVTGVHRVTVPTGHRIAVPQGMDDAYSLWGAPSTFGSLEEGSSRPVPTAAAKTADTAAGSSEHSAPVRTARDHLQAPASGEDRARAWLPNGEEAIMERAVARLRGNPELARRVFSRAGEHLPVIFEELDRVGLPPELACLPLVESAFQVRAVSPAGAAGLWQLMPQTARRYGLRVENGRDERFDVRKSTAAAARYLVFLKQKFGDWPLALAAYNCGEGNMQRAISATGASDLSSLVAAARQRRGVLREETLQFVSRFAAALEIMHGAGMVPHGPMPLPVTTLAALEDTVENATAVPVVPGGSDETLTLRGRYQGVSIPADQPPKSRRMQ